MKNEWKWLAIIGVISILIIGSTTDFTFRDIKIQLLDTYIVLSSFNTILFLTGACYIMTNSFRIVDLITDRNIVMAILVSIVNPLVGLFTAILLYYNIDMLFRFKKIYPGMDSTGQLGLIFILSGIMALQTILEIRVLKKFIGGIRQS